jgi:hypothetical protein
MYGNGVTLGKRTEVTAKVSVEELNRSPIVDRDAHDVGSRGCGSPILTIPAQVERNGRHRPTLLAHLL